MLNFGASKPRIKGVGAQAPRAPLDLHLTRRSASVHPGIPPPPSGKQIPPEGGIPTGKETPPRRRQPPPEGSTPRDMVNERPVRILLECILVAFVFA